jgi:hypothetical protein
MWEGRIPRISDNRLYGNCRDTGAGLGKAGWDRQPRGLTTRLALPHAIRLLLMPGDRHDDAKLYTPSSGDFCGHCSSPVDAGCSRLADHGGYGMGSDVHAGLAELDCVCRFRFPRLAGVHRIPFLRGARARSVSD